MSKGPEDPLFLDADTVLVVNARHFPTKRHCLVDRHLLESAIHAPYNLWMYDDDSDIFDIAASYCFHIAKNHPFADGNKRTALDTAYRFLCINGIDITVRSSYPTEIQIPNERIVEDVVELVENKVSEKDFAARLFITAGPYYINEEIQKFFASNQINRTFKTKSEAIAYFYDQVFCAIISSLMKICEIKHINPNRFRIAENMIRDQLFLRIPEEYRSQFGVDKPTSE